MADEVHPSVSRSQESVRQPSINRPLADACGEQLPACHYSLLAIREPYDQTVIPPREAFSLHIRENPSLAEHAPSRGPKTTPVASPASVVWVEARGDQVLRRPVPGVLYPWVKRASWFELGLFAALVFFWLMPGFETQTMVFGWAHGLGFIALALLIWVAILRREAPYVLLAATLTPVGPLGSVIAIEWLDRRRAAA